MVVGEWAEVMIIWNQFFGGFLTLPHVMHGEGNGSPLQDSCWKIPWTEGPGGLQSMGWLTGEHDWATSLSLFTFMHWRRKWLKRLSSSSSSMSCRILVLQPRIKPVPPAVEARNLNHWTAREIPGTSFSLAIFYVSKTLNTLGWGKTKILGSVNWVDFLWEFGLVLWSRNTPCCWHYSEQCLLHKN